MRRAGRCCCCLLRCMQRCKSKERRSCSPCSIGLREKKKSTTATKKAKAQHCLQAKTITPSALQNTNTKKKSMQWKNRTNQQRQAYHKTWFIYIIYTYILILYIYIYTHTHTYIYIYIYVCVCACICVCVWMDGYMHIQEP